MKYFLSLIFLLFPLISFAQENTGTSINNTGSSISDNTQTLPLETCENLYKIE